VKVKDKKKSIGNQCLRKLLSFSEKKCVRVKYYPQKRQMRKKEIVINESVEWKEFMKMIKSLLGLFSLSQFSLILSHFYSNFYSNEI
jgi:hypothetical protein